MKKKLESFLVCVDFTNDIPVLVIGTKAKNGINIINAFQGEEAEELYEKLTTKKNSGKESSNELSIRPVSGQA